MHKYNRRTFINYTQVFYDIICIIISFIIAIVFSYENNYLHNMYINLWIPVLFSVIYICIMYIMDMYNITTFTYQDRALRNIMLSSIFAYVVCLFMLVYVQPENANKLFFTVFLLALLLIIICQYILTREVRKIKNNHWESRAIIIGSRENIQEYLYYLKKTSFAVNMLGYISIDGNDNIQNLTNIGSLSDLNSILTHHAVDEIIFAIHHDKIKEIEQYILLCEERGLIARIALDFSELNRVKSYIHSVGTIPVLTFHTVVQNNFKKSLKRLFDFTVSFVGFLILLIVSIPLIPLILISSSGSVFLLEDYITLNGRTFKLIRFSANTQKRIGRFLRRTGLVGLPQMINVLKGQMSIVGTRPTTPLEIEAFTNQDFRRLSIKPGITGFWRLKKHKSPYNSEEIMAIDERYIDNWSFGRDFIIFIKTFFLILFGKADKE